MAECLASCTPCATCDLGPLADRIGALEKTVKGLQPAGLGPYVVENAGNILLLAGFALLLFLLWRLRGLFDPERFRLKSATFGLAGQSVTVEAAAQEMSAFLSAVQDHAVQDAAGADSLTVWARKFVGAVDAGKAAPADPALMPGLRALAALPELAPGLMPGPAPGFAREPDPKPETFANLPEPPDLAELAVLWVAAGAEDASRFARMVVQKMGNRVDFAGGVEPALSRLRSGLRYDLVVVEVEAAGGAGLQPLELARQLIDGVRNHAHLDPLREAEVGPGMRLAVLAKGAAKVWAATQLADAVARLGAGRQQQVAPNYLVVDDFYLLRGRIRWLQKQAR